MEKHIKIKITGKVQGVGFRHNTKQKAEELCIKGFVENVYDGSVYIEASGTEGQIEQFVGWCYHGPKWAFVEHVDLCENTGTNFKNFSIR